MTLPSAMIAHSPSAKRTFISLRSQQNHRNSAAAAKLTASPQTVAIKHCAQRGETRKHLKQHRSRHRHGLFYALPVRQNQDDGAHDAQHHFHQGQKTACNRRRRAPQPAPPTTLNFHPLTLPFSVC